MKKPTIHEKRKAGRAAFNAIKKDMDAWCNRTPGEVQLRYIAKYSLLPARVKKMFELIGRWHLEQLAKNKTDQK